MKTCNRCKQEKELCEYSTNKRKSDGKQAFCKSCNKEYLKLHYNSNRSYYKAKAKRLKLSLREVNLPKYIELLKSSSCVDCGINNPVVLDFDHVDPKEKEYSVSNLVAWANWDKVLLEIKKCEIRCANCHRIRTAKQFGWIKNYN